MEQELLYIFIRSISILVILFLLTKLMGKKQVSQMNMYDYLIGITIGNIAADISLNLDRNFWSGLISLSIYGLSSIIVTYLALNNLKFRRIFNGSPSVLIDSGKILVDNLRKEGVDINSLQEEARLNGYFDLDKINYAIIETNGQISFLPKAKDEYVTNSNMKLKIKETKLGINLIQDGVVLEDNMKYLSKDKKWLKKIINKQGYSNIEEVFLLTYKEDNDIKIYGYDIKKNDG